MRRMVSGYILFGPLVFLNVLFDVRFLKLFVMLVWCAWEGAHSRGQGSWGSKF